MNKKEYLYLIKIIKNVLNNEQTLLDDNIDYRVLYNISSNHSLLMFLYHGLKKYNIDNISDMLQKKYNEGLYKTVVQEAEMEEICKQLEQHKIKYMPLKGFVLKKLYPSVELRTMSDFDCLFDNDKTKLVKEIMVKLNYSVEVYKKSTHDVYQKKPFMDVEMHRELMSDSYKLSKYYKTIWNNVIKVENKQFEYKLSNEDFYIFMIAHLAKHYAIGGAGIRNFIDIYLYVNKYNNLNFDYINTELTKMGIKKFSDYCLMLSNYWFGDGENNEILDSFANVVFESGIYGTHQHSMIIEMFITDEGSNNLQSSKIKYIFRRLFPSFETMARRNKILKKIPILLPWFYFTRLIKGLFNYKSHKMVMNSVNNVTTKQVDNVIKVHKELGVEDIL